MDVVALVVGLLGGALIGVLAGWLMAKRKSTETESLLAAAQRENKLGSDRIQKIEEELAQERNTLSELRVQAGSERAEYEQRDKNHLERIEYLQKFEQNLKDSFQSLSTEVLHGSTEQLLKSAEELLKQHKERAEGDLDLRHKAIESVVGPLKEKLGELEELNQHLDRRRAEDHRSLEDLLGRLDKGTGQLITALQGSGSSGRFGEMTLKNLMEMAGLLEGTDYFAQSTVETSAGKGRPDFVVRMPGGSEIIIDAKAPVQDFEALEDEGPESDARPKALATKLLGYAKDLRGRDYAGREDAPDFVVMFIASESTYRLAIQGNPDLVGKALEYGVVIASPTNLLGLLKVVQFGWRQERLAVEARNIQKIGKDLYDAVCTLNDHYSELGRRLSGAVKSYNAFGGSLERRVLPRARRMKDSGIQGKVDIAEFEAIDGPAQELSSAELLGGNTKSIGTEPAKSDDDQPGLSI